MARRRSSAWEFEPWGGDFVLGTDSLGRDMLSRLIYGARNSIGIALATTIIAFVVGAALGLLAAVLGGWIDQALSRFVDLMIRHPGARLRAAAPVDLRHLDPDADPHHLGARADPRLPPCPRGGDGHRRHGLRGGRPPARRRALVARPARDPAQHHGPAGGRVRAAVLLRLLAISALSFLGLGIQPPTADWGSMVRDNAMMITFGDITPLLPAACIALLTVSINFVVDWMLHRASGLKD
jgi:peptide/nickel transport system permease protein